MLKPGGFDSIRDTEYDCLVIGLVVEQRHQNDMVESGFDGFYTYFASVGFTWGSSRENWHVMATFAEEHDLLYIPSVGPGYIDTRVRPWNAANTRKRVKGKLQLYPNCRNMDIFQLHFSRYFLTILSSYSISC